MSIAACGSTSTVSAVAGSWIWAWHTDQGSTCQAGIYQAIDAGSARGAGLLDRNCCYANFRAMQRALAGGNPTDQSGLVNRDRYNRASVNIALGGFPYTKVQYANGTIDNVDGVQVTPGLPSFILQGYGDGFEIIH
ncbi:MAG: hypothetical protein Q9203_005164 [Teloschistes exilis]